MNKFHDLINNALLTLGKEKISLKEAQYKALKAIVINKKDSLVILPTGYGKSLIYQTLPHCLL
jgi:superfamily II DNA helicase RecQ